MRERVRVRRERERQRDRRKTKPVWGEFGPGENQNRTQLNDSLITKQNELIEI